MTYPFSSFKNKISEQFLKLNRALLNYTDNILCILAHNPRLLQNVIFSISTDITYLLHCFLAECYNFKVNNGILFPPSTFRHMGNSEK